MSRIFYSIQVRAETDKPDDNVSSRYFRIQTGLSVPSPIGTFVFFTERNPPSRADAECCQVVQYIHNLLTDECQEPDVHPGDFYCILSEGDSEEGIKLAQEYADDFCLYLKEKGWEEFSGVL